MNRNFSPPYYLHSTVRNAEHFDEEYLQEKIAQITPDHSNLTPSTLRSLAESLLAKQAEADLTSEAGFRYESEAISEYHHTPKP